MCGRASRTRCRPGRRCRRRGSCRPARCASASRPRPCSDRDASAGRRRVRSRCVRRCRSAARSRAPVGQLPIRIAAVRPGAMRDSRTGLVTGDSVHLHVPASSSAISGPTWKTWSRTPGERGGELQAGGGAGPVALATEEGLDRERVVLAGREAGGGRALTEAPRVVDDRVEPVGNRRRGCEQDEDEERGGEERQERCEVPDAVDMWGLGSHDPTVDLAPNGSPTRRQRALTEPG